MRVAHLVRRVDLNDGVASHLATLAGGLASRGHEVVLLSGPVGGREDAPERWRAIREATSAWVVADRQPAGREGRRWLRRAVREHAPDVLHVHGLKPLPLARLALGWRVPLVATAHPSRTSTPDPRPAVKRLLRLARPLARRLHPDRAIAPSSELARWYVEQADVRPDRVRLVPHGVDDGAFTPPTEDQRRDARRALSLGEGTFACLSVGRLDRGKRHDTAVAALARLAAEGRRVALRVSGSGEGEAEVRAACRAADPGGRVDVRFLGYAADSAALYHAADALVLASEREGFALVVAEAMLSGLVPLRTPTGGAADQIEPGVNGFLFDVGDDAALAGCVRALIDDPARRRLMAAAAGATARARFTAGAMTQGTLAVYREVTAGRADRADRADRAGRPWEDEP